jgi:glycerate kinase
VDVLARGGLALAGVGEADLLDLAQVRLRLADVDIVVATDVDNPLLGLDGASAVYGPQKGASPQLAQELEWALGRFADVVGRLSPGGRDLFTGVARRLDREPGAGAGGGLGFGLLVLGGRRVSGVEEVLRAVGFGDRLGSSDLVLTGEGSLDWQSLHGKAVAGVAAAALEHGVPAVVVAGQVFLGRRETMSLGLSGCYAVAETPEQVEAAMADPVGTLTERVARVARTWSPPR